MKKKTSFIFLIAFCFFLRLNAQTEIFVSPDGDDTNSGSIGAPLKTLEGARDVVRLIKSSSGLPSGGIVVNFREGRYPVTSTCNFDAQDAGDSGSPIVYRGYNDEEVIFDGSVILNTNGFVATTSADASLLHSTAVGNVMVQTLTDPTLISALQSTTAQVHMDDKMLTIARFPNIGYAHINPSTLTAGYESINVEGTFSSPKGARFQLYETISDVSKWASEISRTQRVTAYGYISADWYKEDILVASGTGGYLRLKDGSKYGIKTDSDPKRLFLNQLLCELDEPGEWYFDAGTNKFYIWPLNAIDDQSTIGVWAGPEMVRIENSHDIQFKYLTVQCLGEGVNGDGAINFRSGYSFLVAGVTFRYIAAPLLACNFWQNVKESKMLSCDFFDIWNNTRLYGGAFTSTGTIERGNNSIENCHFTQIYSKDLYGKACGMSGVGNTFKNNLIHNMNGQPVTHAGIDHLIELNEAFNVGIEEGDGGAFYTGNDIMSYGNVIRHNFMHHIMSVPQLLGRAAFFSDDYDGGEDVLENVVYKGGWEALKMNKGAGHSVMRNVVLDCYTGIRQGNGGTSGYNTAMEYINSANGKSPTSSDKNNYVGRMLMKVGTPDWETGLNETNWESRIEQFWRDRYTRFHWAMRAYSNNNQMNAYECRFYDNMFWSNNTNINDGGSAANDRGSQNVDLTIFENPDNLNFKFKEPRPTYAPDIPFENIGLYLDEYRCAIPNKDDYRRAIKQHFEHLACHTSDSYNTNTINDRLYYNTGKMVMATVPCANTYTQTEFYFDLGTTTSKVFSDYERLSNQTTPGVYGWTNTTGLNAVDRGTSSAANDLNRDIIYSSQARTLDVEVPNGYYNVLITFGDVSASHDLITVKAEGVLKLNNINTTAGNSFFNRDFDVEVIDGVLSIEFSDGGGSDANWVASRIIIKPTSAPQIPDQTPYGGVPLNIPGTIEAELYDVGGEGIAYHDATSGNSGGLVRTDDVDIEARDGGYNVGWTVDGEWLEYTVNATPGTYNMQARVAAKKSGKQIKVLLDNTELGTFDIPNTGNWGTFHTITINNVSIDGGSGKILRFEFIGGSTNLNWIKFSQVAPTNVATGKSVWQSSDNYSTKGKAELANDGNTDGVFNNLSVTHTQSDAQAWWKVDLGAVFDITDVKVYNRTDCCGSRLLNFYVLVSETDFTSNDLNATLSDASVSDFYVAGEGGTPSTVSVNNTGRFVRVQLSGTNFLSLAEVEVLSTGLKSAYVNEPVTLSDRNIEASVFPNPFEDSFTINVKNTNGEEVNVELFNALGKRLKTETFCTGKCEISSSGITSGVYFLRVTCKNESIYKKLIKE